MSGENVQIVRRGFEHYQATGELLLDNTDPEFVWDMSTFRGWPEEKTYAGLEGAQRFLRNWRDSWDEWQLEVESFHDAGDKVVVVVRQQGRAKETGMWIDMTFAQVVTVRHRQQVRVQIYADPSEAFEAVGMRKQAMSQENVEQRPLP